MAPQEDNDCPGELELSEESENSDSGEDFTSPPTLHMHESDQDLDDDGEAAPDTPTDSQTLSKSNDKGPYHPIPPAAPGLGPSTSCEDLSRADSDFDMVLFPSRDTDTSKDCTSELVDEQHTQLLNIVQTRAGGNKCFL